MSLTSKHEHPLSVVQLTPPSEVQTRVWGYPTEGAYRRDASSTDPVMAVKIPLFAINATDDPVSISSWRAVPCADNVIDLWSSFYSVRRNSGESIRGVMHNELGRSYWLVRDWWWQMVCEACKSCYSLVSACC